MKNCARCPKPGGCRSEPCRFAAYQDRTPSRPMTTRQEVLMTRMRKPVKHDEPEAVTGWWWNHIRQAYGHLCDRANAWDDRPAKQLAVEDVSGLYGDAPETPSQSTLPAEPVKSGVRLPITPSNSSAVVSAMWAAADDGMPPTCHYGPHPDAGPAGPKTFGITHPAGVSPPEVEVRVTDQIDQRRIASEVADFMQENGFTLTEWHREVAAQTLRSAAQYGGPGRPGFWERAIKRVFG